MEFDPKKHPSISKVKKFVQSILNGNANKLLEVISEDVAMYSDGSGKVKAAQIPFFGAAKVVH